MLNFKETAAIFFPFFIDLEHAFARKDRVNVDFVYWISILIHKWRF